jgi:hypothetical protein
MFRNKESGLYEFGGEWNPDGLIECDATGTGCLMFEMSVFRKMPRPWFKFRTDEKNGMPIGEDIGFCQDLKEAGYRVFVDCTVPAGHLATMVINRNTHLLYRAMKAKQNEAILTALEADKNN